MVFFLMIRGRCLISKLTVLSRFIPRNNATDRPDADTVAFDIYGDIPLIFSPLKNLNFAVNPSTGCRCQIATAPDSLKGLKQTVNF